MMLIYVERKSSEFKNNTSDIKSSSKVSSTGAYNSITKTPKYLAKNGKQVYLQRVPKATGKLCFNQKMTNRCKNEQEDKAKESKQHIGKLETYLSNVRDWV